MRTRATISSTRWPAVSRASPRRLSQPGDPADERFQDQRIRRASGRRAFEPKEENPMIGFRGASRYYSDAYREGFAAGMPRDQAMLREEMGFDNVLVMIPFCRTPDEADRVLAVMAENAGLKRGENGLQVYVMCEIPSNVILAARVRQTLRRLLHRLKRPDPADPWASTAIPASRPCPRGRCESRAVRPGAIQQPGLRQAFGAGGHRHHLGDTRQLRCRQDKRGGGGESRQLNSNGLTIQVIETALPDM
jgi:hypothetical protein